MILDIKQPLYFNSGSNLKVSSILLTFPQLTDTQARLILWPSNSRVMEKEFTQSSTSGTGSNTMGSIPVHAQGLSFHSLSPSFTSLSSSLPPPSHTHTHTHTTMADRNSRLSVKKKEKKVEGKPSEEKDKGGKKADKVVKKPEKSPGEPKAEVEKTNGGDEGATGEAKISKENGEFEPIELPPFEIVKGEQMSAFYFKFQFRNVEYSSGRNKTLLCFRVDTAGGEAEPLKGYMEDEHATAHVEEAFFQQVLSNPSQECDVTWYVSSSPCPACAAKLTNVLRQRKKLRLSIFCSRLFDWDQPEIVEGLKALVSVGCKLRMMKPSDFVHVWETYVEKEDQSFAPWEDCQENYSYYMEKLAEILK